jgi:hypothetical protein
MYVTKTGSMAELQSLKKKSQLNLKNAKKVHFKTLPPRNPEMIIYLLYSI